MVHFTPKSCEDHQGKWLIGVCIGVLALPLMVSTYNSQLYHQVKAIKTKKDLNTGWLTIYCPSNDPKHTPYLITANNMRKSLRFLSFCTPRSRLHDQISRTIEYYQPSERGMHFHPGWYYSLPLSERIAMRPFLTLADSNKALPDSSGLQWGPA